MHSSAIRCDKPTEWKFLQQPQQKQQPMNATITTTTTIPMAIKEEQEQEVEYISTLSFPLQLHLSQLIQHMYPKMRTMTKELTPVVDHRKGFPITLKMLKNLKNRT